uniref:Uncharacterized protein n=1 Tax=Clastoptera arizonana TaxID=38151 RepID=A0A1B6CXA6_9HEMI
METPPNEAPMRRTTRSALAEIPARLGALTVLDNYRDTPVARHRNINNNNTLNSQTLLVDVHMNLPASYISPSPSPDELVIQQRGRRRMPVTWSPDVDCRKREGGGSVRERTPVKSPSKSTIVLRSTPRKRLLLNDSLELCSSPDKNKKLYSPSIKKCRLDQPAGPIETALKGLSSDQLIDIIQNLVKNNTELEEELKSIIPAPDLKPLEERMNDLKRNIFKSLPTSRLTSKTDSPAYNRAATHVIAFKKCVLEQGRNLVESQQWSAVVDYVLLSWSYVRSTPLWDNPPHNAARRQCFKSLAAMCMNALKKGQFSPEICNELYKKFESCVPDSEDMKSCLKQLDILRKNC